MSGSDNDTPDDDDRTVFTPQPPVPGQSGTSSGPAAGAAGPFDEEDDDDRTQFAPGAQVPPGAQAAWPEDGSQDAPQGYPGATAAPYAAAAGAAAAASASQPPQATPHTTTQSTPPQSPPQGGFRDPTRTEATGYPQAAAPAHDVGVTGQPAAQAYPGSVPPQDPTAYPSDPAAPPTPAEAARNDGKLPIGTLINNNYRIEEVLKSGGMGEVYRGSEIHTGDPVAIKAILQEKADDAEAGLMFLREAKTLRRLVDETIVRYYNYVPDPELQRYFMIMEFIEGVPLKDHVAQNGPLSVDETKTLLARLAGGLATAHDAEVIHRDLSPDNVMLEGGRVENARLIDFGIAQSNVVKEATMAGRFAGKFKYVAPEQLGHYGGHISPATDIYGLALLTAAAAIGKPLDMGSSIVEAVQSRQSIPDLSFVPEELRPILSYMLEPNPEARPASMLAVKALVEDPHSIPEQYLGGWVPPAPPPLNTTPPGTASSGVTVTGTMAPGLQIPGATQNVTLNTSLGPIPVPEPEKPKSGGGGIVLVLALVLLAAIGGGGWYAYDQGLIGPTPTPEGPDEQAGTDGTPPEQPVAGIPEPLTNTREGFLANFETGPCTFVTRVSQGANAGVIEGYSATRERFAGLPTAYEERFGARPEVLPREIAPTQCAVLDFAKALQGRGRNGVEMFLSADEVVSETPVTAQLTVPQGQAIWLILVSPTGGIINLTDRLSQPVGNQRNMSFALSLRQGTDPAPQMLLAVESDEPLAHAALAKRGEQASAVLPRLLEEITERGGAASAAVSYLSLVPSSQ